MKIKENCKEKTFYVFKTQCLQETNKRIEMFIYLTVLTLQGSSKIIYF